MKRERLLIQTHSDDVAQRLLEWVDANIPHTRCYVGTHDYFQGKLRDASGTKHGMGIKGVVFHFYEDDRVLFDMRYAGEFDVFDTGYWCERADVISYHHAISMSVGRLIAHSARAIAAVHEAIEAMPVEPVPPAGKWRNPDPHIRKFKR